MGYNKNSYFYNKSGHRVPKRAIDTYYKVDTKPNKKSDDTKIRELVLQEIEERCSNGENLEIVAEEIANREEIKVHFSYYEKNKIGTPLKEIFMNWYNSKNRNKNTIDKLNCII